MNSITEPINTGDYEYIVLENGTVEITGYTGSARELVIPAKLDGHVVSSLGDEAFGGCDGLTRITIPGSLVCIGKNPFTGCLILPDVLVAADHPTLETIDGVLFEKRTRTLVCCPCAFPQKHYAIPQGTKAIGDCAFEDCDALISVTIPDSVTSIGEYAFDGCESLTSVAIPDSVVSIGNHAFYHCLALTSVNIPDGVTIIGNDTFGSCASLPSITIPDGVTSIGDYAFHSCNALSSITIPDGVTSIGDGAFKYCSSLTAITIPDSVTSIGDEAFNCCIFLTSITIPDSVTHIGADAFQDCSALTAITVGRNSFAAQYCKDNGLPYTYADDVQP